MDTTCNGWTNYATWRVNIEMLDEINPPDMDWPTSVVALADTLRDYVKDYICESTNNDIAMGYALAFISEVDWQQIADRMIEAYTEA